MIEHKNIHEAINAVMDEVGYVKKSKSGGLNYSFAGEAALIAAIRPAMVEHGIYMSVSNVFSVSREPYTTKSGTSMTNTIIQAEVKFTHVSGDSITVASIGEGSDSGDKGANKAMTGLYKYALRQTFCIETGDDPDKYANDERSDVSDELWKHFTALYVKAQKLGVKNLKSSLRTDWNKETLTAYGIELGEAVKAIETQNKEGK